MSNSDTDDMRREIERRMIDPLTPDDIRRELEDAAAGTGARSDCGAIKERSLAIQDLAKRFPIEGVVASDLVEDWQSAALRTHVVATQAECITQQEKKDLNVIGRQVARDIGSKAVFDSANRYDRAIRNAFAGKAAGMGPG